MNCCINCFKDKEIIGFILSNSSSNGKCDICSSPDLPLADTRELGESFQPVVALFKTVADLGINVDEPKLLHEKLQEYWSVFNLLPAQAAILIKAIMADHMADTHPLLNTAVEIELLSGTVLAGDVHEKKWEGFAQEIKTKNRFFLNETIDLPLLAGLFPNFSRTYDKGKIFYRGRVSDKKGIEAGYMGKPPAEVSTPGRANPKGIPYLYLATKIGTTVYESRATYPDYISIAEFRTIEPIRVVSLRAISAASPFGFGDNISHYITHQKYLSRLEQELSKPIRRFDKELDYLPSQYLCEYVKSLGYDAIEYGSSFRTDGINLAVFNDEKLEIKGIEVYEVTDMNLITVKQ